MTSRRKWWIGGLIGLVLSFGIVSISVPAGFPMLAFGDITQFLLLFLAFLLMVANAVSSRGQIRLFLGSDGGWLPVVVGQPEFMDDLRSNFARDLPSRLSGT